MFWKKKPKTVHVELFDADTGKQFSASDVPVERLPASFEASTTMHLGQEDWEVVQAKPMTAADFGRTGKLQLLLRRVRVEKIDPRKVLFSLPTISDALPGVAAGSTKLGKNVLEFHEDNWRQVELVSLGLQGEIDAELASIRTIYEHHYKKPGFDRIHARTRIPAPLPDSTLTVDEVATALGGRDAARCDGVAFAGVAGLVERAFAIQSISGITLYGQTTSAGMVSVLGLSNERANNLGPQRDALALADLARRHGLGLADWCRAVWVTADEFDGYFGEMNKPT